MVFLSRCSTEKNFLKHKDTVLRNSSLQMLRKEANKTHIFFVCETFVHELKAKVLQKSLKAFAESQKRREGDGFAQSGFSGTKQLSVHT